MLRSPAGLVLGCVLAAVGPLQAQQPVRFTQWRPAAVTRESRLRSTQLPDSLRGRGNHRKPGAVLGALAIGTLGVLITSRSCPVYPGEGCDLLTWGDAVVGGTVGTITGGLIGYVIGSALPKGHGDRSGTRTSAHRLQTDSR